MQSLLPPSPSPTPPSSCGPITLDVPIAEETMSSSPQKKHKTDDEEGDGDIDLMTLGADEYNSEEDYCTDGSGKMDKDLWERYYQQVEESEGFDIQDFPGRCWMTTVFPMPYYLNDPKNVIELKDYAGKALKIYNDSNGTEYEVKDILKVNGGGCRDFVYYITFTVTNGEYNTSFQAKVMECIGIDRPLEILLVRPKI